jgi:hypothetical protein
MRFRLEGYHPEYIEAVETEAAERIQYYMGKGKIMLGVGGLQPNPHYAQQPVTIRARTPNVASTVMNGGRFLPANARPEQLR